MINFLLKNPSLYRFYQKTVRAKYNEYDFFRFIFKQNNFKKIRMLDICCGDGHILEHVNEFISEYIGIDNNDKYLEQCRNRWRKFNFINLELNDTANIDRLLKFEPNFNSRSKFAVSLSSKFIKLNFLQRFLHCSRYLSLLSRPIYSVMNSFICSKICPSPQQISSILIFLKFFCLKMNLKKSYSLYLALTVFW